MAISAAPCIAAGAPYRLTPYEQKTVERSAASLGLAPELDPEADGKLVERVDVVVLDVFDQDDPVPDFFNVFHTMSQEQVIRRELLTVAGERYVARDADESARNLRKLRQLSLVVVVPLKGSAPDRVRVLVIVRDVWSLRMNSDFEISESGLGYLLLSPSEENLAGSHATLGGLFILDPGRYSFGGVGTHRRIVGTNLEAVLGLNLIFNRDSGEQEGSFGYFAYGAPLLKAEDRWGYGTGVSFRDDVVRRFRGTALDTYDAPATAADEALPIAYRRELIQGATEVVRSFGRLHKYDVGVGFEVDRRAYRYRPPPGTPPEAEAAFRRTWLPVSDTRLGPYLRLYAHHEHFHRTTALETLGLQEDYRLGPELTLSLSPASGDFGSTRTSLTTRAGLAYTFALGDGLVRVLGINTIRLSLNRKHDAAYLAQLRVASPRFGFGRLVFDGYLAERYRNFLNTRYALGGDGRMRGYPPSDFEHSFEGAHTFAANAEFRSGSLEILSAQLGMAVFHDVGHAARRFRDLEAHHATGLGVRILLPQASRSVLRADWAFPWNPPPGMSTLPGGFFITFGQAFGIPDLETPNLANPERYLTGVQQ